MPAKSTITDCMVKPVKVKSVKSSKPKAAPAPKPDGPRIVAPEEHTPDGEVLCRFTIPGQPATKKTSQRKTRFGILPSLQYLRYEAHCAPYCLAAWTGQGQTAQEWETLLLGRYKDLQKLPKENVWEEFPAFIEQGMQPMDFGVVLTMRVYLNTWQVGDCTGYQQSIADILQKFGVIANDSWLHWDWEGEHWFGGKDVDNPRVEVTLKRCRHPKESYRAEQEADLVAKQQRAIARAAKKTQGDHHE